MKLFKRDKDKPNAVNQSALAEIALKSINDGVIVVDRAGVIIFINPAALRMTNFPTTNSALGLDYGLLIRLESKEGRELPETENPLIQAIKTNQPLDSYRGNLIIGQTDKRMPISVSVTPVNNMGQNKIITFRDITKELKEEGEQAEFVSTASHEMRTPVATIDGYLSLALNPQTATIDERARGYLSAAESASKHLGKLFQDLLDATKIEDGRIRPKFEPAEMVGMVKMIVDGYLTRAKESKINLTFGSNEAISPGGSRKMNQIVYGFIDTNFMREIMDNLIDNAIKYTPEGGSIYVNVRGDGDRVLINVTDTGIGISADDISHIFQKFYRADNSDTRTIGGTGLGLFLVKQRVEAMGGKVWAESAFGEGSTFYVSLPRLTSDEYEKRMIAVRQSQIAEQLRQQTAAAYPGTQVQLVQPAQPTPPAPPAQPTPPAPPAQPAPPALPIQPIQTVQQTQNQINTNVNGEIK